MDLTLAFPYQVYGTGSWTDYKYTSGSASFSPNIGSAQHHLKAASSPCASLSSIWHPWSRFASLNFPSLAHFTPRSHDGRGAHGGHGPDQQHHPVHADGPQPLAPSPVVRRPQVPVALLLPPSQHLYHDTLSRPVAPPPPLSRPVASPPPWRLTPPPNPASPGALPRRSCSSSAFLPLVRGERSPRWPAHEGMRAGARRLRARTPSHEGMPVPLRTKGCPYPLVRRPAGTGLRNLRQGAMGTLWICNGGDVTGHDGEEASAFRVRHLSGTAT